MQKQSIASVNRDRDRWDFTYPVGLFLSLHRPGFTLDISLIIGDIYGADKTQPSYWIGMIAAVIIFAVLTYFTAGAFVEGIAICALGKVLIGIMGLITANVCCNLSNEARVKGYELYGDIFEFASILLQTYVLNELIQGIAEGWNSLKEKISNVWQPNKRGAVGFGSSSNIDYSTISQGTNDPVNRRGVGGQGWRGDRIWRQNVDKVKDGGTVLDLNGQVPTEQEAMDLINEAGGTVNRIEGPHTAPNPHNFNHINYTTPNGRKGTIRII